MDILIINVSARAIRDIKIHLLGKGLKVTARPKKKKKKKKKKDKLCTTPNLLRLAQGDCLSIHLIFFESDEINERKNGFFGKDQIK